MEVNSNSRKVEEENLRLKQVVEELKRRKKEEESKN